MTRRQVFEELNEIFRDMFDDEGISLRDETTAADVEGWDSLMHINLILAVERRFGVKFTMGEIDGMKSVGAMADMILARTAR